MRRLRITGLVALLAVLLAPAACKQTDSILVVYVSGPKDLVNNAPQQLRVTVSSGSDARSFIVPGNPPPVMLPASFTIAFDRSHVGPITVSIDALDGNGAPIGYAGTTAMDHINIGGQTDVAVELVLVPPPDQIDAGSDGSTDGGAGMGGAGGSGGGGGGAGQGGASGQDADGAADAADAMGLDTAAD